MSEIADTKLDPVLYTATGDEFQETTKDRGLKTYCDNLRKLGISDLMLRQYPARVMVVRRGIFYRIEPKLVPAASAWLAAFASHVAAPGPYHDRWLKSGVSDRGLELPGGGIARLHLWKSRKGLQVSIRIQPEKPPTLDDVLPIVDEKREQLIREDLVRMFTQRQGLIIIGGQVRSGKTWLEHALYNSLNSDPALSGGHAYLIGDPLEFEHEDKGWAFTPVDLGDRQTTQAQEIHSSLRVPRSVLGAGEMRGDTASTEAAITGALSGGLVVATGHFGSVDDIISRFSLGSEAMSEASKRTMLLEVIRGIVHLALVPGTRDNEEVVVSYTDFSRNKNLIADLKNGTHQGSKAIAEGYRPVAADVTQLLQKGRIHRDVANRLIGTV